MEDQTTCTDPGINNNKKVINSLKSRTVLFRTENGSRMKQDSSLRTNSTYQLVLFVFVYFTSATLFQTVVTFQTFYLEVL